MQEIVLSSSKPCAFVASEKVYHCAHCIKEHPVLSKMGKTFIYLFIYFYRKQMLLMKRDGASAQLFSKTNLQYADITTTLQSAFTVLKKCNEVKK